MVEIETVNLRLTLNKRQLLDVPKFVVKQGECVSLIGANGAGKSLLLEAIAGLYPVDGCVKFFRVDGESRVSVPRSELCIGALLQRIKLWEAAKVGEILDLVSVVNGSPMPLDEFLSQIAGRPYRGLSVGERQYLHFVIAANAPADFYLFDEPFLGLDAQNELRLFAALNRLKGTRLIAFHNFRHVIGASDRCYFMCGGCPIELVIVPIDQLVRQAVVEAVADSDADGESLFTRRIEVDREASIELINRELIPFINGSQVRERSLQLKLKVPRRIYDSCRAENSSIGALEPEALLS